MEDKEQFTLDLSKGKPVLTPREKKDEKIQGNIFAFYLGSAGQIGFSILIPLLLGLGIGIWLDSHFQKKPLFTLSGLLLGFLISIANLFLTVRTIIKQTQSKK
jgi:predicted F0F1-ATPase subunit